MNIDQLIKDKTIIYYTEMDGVDECIITHKIKYSSNVDVIIDQLPINVRKVVEQNMYNETCIYLENLTNPNREYWDAFMSVDTFEECIWEPHLEYVAKQSAIDSGNSYIQQFLNKYGVTNRKTEHTVEHKYNNPYRSFNSQIFYDGEMKDDGQYNSFLYGINISTSVGDSNNYSNRDGKVIKSEFTISKRNPSIDYVNFPDLSVIAFNGGIVHNNRGNVFINDDKMTTNYKYEEWCNDVDRAMVMHLEYITEILDDSREIFINKNLVYQKGNNYVIDISNVLSYYTCEIIKPQEGKYRNHGLTISKMPTFTHTINKEEIITYIFEKMIKYVDTFKIKTEFKY